MADEVVPIPVPVPVIPKPWWQSKIMWVAILTALAGAGDALSGSAVLGSQIGDLVIALVGIINLFLRRITAQPIG